MKEAVGEPFLLQSLIVPVAIVDPPTITANIVPIILAASFSAGELTAPLAAARLADTAALAAGDYDVFATVGAAGTAGSSDIRFQRLQSDNATVVWGTRFGLSHGTGGNSEGDGHEKIGPIRITLLANERLILVMATNAGAGAVLTGNIWVNGPK
jgi:hypothetical protein